jgi:hypothetical protein
VCLIRLPNPQSFYFPQRKNSVQTSLPLFPLLQAFPHLSGLLALGNKNTTAPKHPFHGLGNFLKAGLGAELLDEASQAKVMVSTVQQDSIELDPKRHWFDVECYVSRLALVGSRMSELCTYHYPHQLEPTVYQQHHHTLAWLHLEEARKPVLSMIRHGGLY